MLRATRKGQKSRCPDAYRSELTCCLIPQFDGAILSQEWKEALCPDRSAPRSERSGPALRLFRASRHGEGAADAARRVHHGAVAREPRDAGTANYLGLPDHHRAHREPRAARGLPDRALGHLRVPGAFVPDGCTIHPEPRTRPNIGTTICIPGTNAIESLIRVIRKTTKTRGSFLTDDAATMWIYLVIRKFESTGHYV